MAGKRSMATLAGMLCCRMSGASLARVPADLLMTAGNWSPPSPRATIATKTLGPNPARSFKIFRCRSLSHRGCNTTPITNLLGTAQTNFVVQLNEHTGATRRTTECYQLLKYKHFIHLRKPSPCHFFFLRTFFPQKVSSA